MNRNELFHILIAFLILVIVVTFRDFIALDPGKISLGFLFAAIIIIGHIGSKKIVAYLLDAGVEHKIWFWSRYGFMPHQYLKKELPLGIIIPIIFTIFSLGIVKVMTFLTYESTALKRRAARRFGHYSFTEMTEFHNALIGASSIVFMLIVTIIAVFFEPTAQLAKIAAFYAFFNMIPFSKLDGAQIFFGSRVIWSVLALLSLVFASFALILP